MLGRRAESAVGKRGRQLGRTWRRAGNASVAKDAAALGSSRVLDGAGRTLSRIRRLLPRGKPNLESGVVLIVRLKPHIDEGRRSDVYGFAADYRSDVRWKIVANGRVGRQGEDGGGPG